MAFRVAKGSSITSPPAAFRPVAPSAIVIRFTAGCFVSKKRRIIPIDDGTRRELIAAARVIPGICIRSVEADVPEWVEEAIRMSKYFPDFALGEYLVRMATPSGAAQRQPSN